MEISRIPVTSIQTGFTQEERSFEWKISNFNFPVIRKQKSMINSQKFEFYAGDSVGLGSKWRVFLNVQEKDGVRWAGIFVRMLKKPRATPTPEHLYVQFSFTFEGKDGGMKKKFATRLADWYDASDKTVVKDFTFGYVGISKVFEMNDELPSFMELVDGCLVVHVTFNLFAPASAIRPLKVKLEEFEVKATAKARAQLPMPMMCRPVVPTYVKVIVADQNEFWMQKDILSARSPVFRAMLDADMTEGKDGVVKIQDMGSESLQVLLHFINRGELLPDWSSSDVIVELTNAAAKYELTDLLHFLDGVLGDVCKLDNVGMLIALASSLSLKRAEADLLSFLRREGATSAEKFLQVSAGILASGSGAEEGSGGSAGSSTDLIEGGRPSSSCYCSCCSPRRQGKRSGSSEIRESLATIRP